MLDIKDLWVRYNSIGGVTEAVKGVSLCVEKGSFTGLVGESGSGKSTMMMALLGLLPPRTEVRGKILFNGTDILGMSDSAMRDIRWKEIALVPQGAQNSFTPVMKIKSHIMEVLRVHLGMSLDDAETETARLLGEVGLDPGIKERYPHELSGGQKQRASIALALACSPSLLLADEPTTALDVIVQAEILELLSNLRRTKGLSIILVTHDLPLAATVCDRLVVMKDGSIAEIGTPSEIVNEPKHPHTKDLVREMFRQRDKK
ncbi:MAG TPA: ABC transporter ATP-binding protein [Synergistaceae bacterium]|jgi:ABC-type glutathione transport system ATPase component|nr:ABC transporter ATP-binding protein [Synergistaceae bacterium]NLL41429.1 ABC transporter ATP-binding protein [Synergistaceae bacterium]HPX03650.1 ABC transporter ATP-binding protein [Synergistaceae bacterium]HQA54489.1 ABC transporter ATP-binding protein [Synergistaceae bacterium]